MGLREHARELVGSEQIGRIGHADEIAARVFLEHERAVPARVRLWQLRHDLRVEPEMREIDERNVQRRREAGMQIRLGNGADVDQHAAELAAARALLVERFLELLLGDQLLLEQQVSEPDALAGFGGQGASARGSERREAIRRRLDDSRPVVVVVHDDRPEQDHELGLRLDLAGAAEQPLQARESSEHGREQLAFRDELRIRPPIAMIWPLFALTMLSDSRISLNASGSASVSPETVSSLV